MSAEIKANPDEILLEDTGQKSDYYRVFNIIMSDRRIDGVKVSRSNKYWLRLSDNKYHWVDENELDKAINGTYIPPRKASKKQTTTVKASKSSDEIDAPFKARLTACIHFLIKNYKEPKIDARNPIDKDPLHSYDVSMLIITCKTIGQFMEEVQAYLPFAVKTMENMDWSYLDEPEHEYTAMDLKLKTWYTRLRAQCKVILSKLNLCFGGLQKNGYQFFLTQCFTKEFSKIETKKSSIEVEAKVKSKEKADAEKVDNPALAEVKICFDEEVAKDGNS